MLFETPGYNEIFDLYIAYGAAECLVRDGIENLKFFPRGNKYCIVVEESSVNIKNRIENGMLHALEDMLSLHKAISTRKGIKIISDVDFSTGAIVEHQTQYKTPERLDKILNKLKNGESLSNKNEKETIPLPLMPAAGKYIPKFYGVKGGNPKIDDFFYYYALAWIGFHYYTPYINVSDNRTTYIHIYAIKPLEELELIEILALKDLKKKINKYQIKKDKFFVNKKLALLYHLTHTESISALEIITKKHFSIVSYTLEKVGNNQAIRSFGEYDLSKLMDFLWYLKATDFYNAVQFIDNILKNDLEISLNFIDGILYDNLDAIYLAIRKLKKVPFPIIKAIIRYFENI